MANTLQDMQDIENRLAIHASLPYGDGEDAIYVNSLIDSLSRFLDGKCGFPNIGAMCIDILDILHTLAKLVNDDDADHEIQYDSTKNTYSSNPLLRICYVSSHLQASLFSLYLRLLHQQDIESDKINQVRTVIWLIAYAWDYVLPGEPSAFFWSDIHAQLEEMIYDAGIDYLKWGEDLLPCPDPEVLKTPPQ